MRNPEQKALAVLADALPAEVTITPSDRSSGADVTISGQGRLPISIDLKWAGAGFPRDVERALMGRSENSSALVVTAEAMSEGARHILDERGIAWASADGAANLAVGPIWVVKDPKKSRPSRDVTGINWTDSLSTVAETLLHEAQLHLDIDGGALVPNVTKLSTEAFRSVGSVSSALTTFDRQGWTQRMGAQRGRSARRRLVAPAPMLDEWAANERAVREVAAEYHSLMRDPLQLGLAVASEFEDAVFSGRFAADLLAPYSTEIGKVRCYLPVELPISATEERLSRIGLTRAPGAGRLNVLSAGPHIISQSRLVNGFRLASPVRTYADLLREATRGEEAASHLRAVAIRF